MSAKPSVVRVHSTSADAGNVLPPDGRRGHLELAPGTVAGSHRDNCSAALTRSRVEIALVPDWLTVATADEQSSNRGYRTGGTDEVAHAYAYREPPGYMGHPPAPQGAFDAKDSTT